MEYMNLGGGNRYAIDFLVLNLTYILKEILEKESAIILKTQVQ